MIKEISKRSILLSLIAIIIICLIQIPSFAAGTFSASANKTTLTAGEKATFTANANGCGGRFRISSSNNSVVSIEGSTSEWIENGSHSVTLVANKAGTATITLTAEDVADTATADEIKGSRTVTITVKEIQTPPPANNPSGGNTGSSKSGDATLKSITVAGKTYTNPSTDFTVTVDANVNTTEVSAVPNNSKATISGTGSKELITGSNTIQITVTAENGARKTYSIRIRKLANENTTPNVPDNTPSNTQTPENPDPNSENPNEGTEEPKALRLEYLMLDDVELMPEFNSEIFEYSLYVTNRESLQIIAKANMEDTNVEIIGAEELRDGENEVVIKLTKGEEIVEYKIKVNKTTEEVVLPGAVVGENSSGNGMSMGSTIGIGAGVVTACLGLAGLCIWKLKSGGDAARRTIRGMNNIKKSSFDDFND